MAENHVRQLPKTLTTISLNEWASSRHKQDAPERPDRACPCLRVKARATGKITFRIGYRLAGKQRYYGLGNWDVSSMAPKDQLARLRDRAQAIKRLAETGVDPEKHEQQQKEVQAAEERRRALDTVGAVLELYQRNYLSQIKTGRQNRRALERLVLPIWGDRPITSITRREIGELLQDVHDSGRRYMANRLHGYVMHFLNWCVRRGYLEQSPALLLERPMLKEKSRDHVLSDEEIAALWRASDDGAPHSRLVRFLLATSCRLSEAAEARADELDGALWSIPAERAKNGRAHPLPLSPLAQSIIEPRPVSPGELLFTYGTRPIGGRSKLKHRLDANMLVELKRAALERGDDPDTVELRPWRLHDLRRTAATGMQAAGIPPHVISAVLNHTAATHGASITTRVYARYSYAREMKAAVEAWGARLERIIAGLPVVDAGEVIPFEAAS
jgi:integrase